MRNKLNVQKKMVFRHYWLKDIMPLSKKSILMAALLSLGLVATTDAYAVKGNQTYASGAMADVQSVMQTAKKLTGKVVDAKGESIIGATIKVKGTGQGAISDIDGNFSLPVDTATPTIEISFVGYQTKTVKVTAGTTVLITLDEVTLSCDVFARGVFLSLKGDIDNFISDNYMDILPGKPVTVRVTTDLPGLQFAERLQVTSFLDAVEL